MLNEHAGDIWSIHGAAPQGQGCYVAPAADLRIRGRKLMLASDDNQDIVTRRRMAETCKSKEVCCSCPETHADGTGKEDPSYVEVYCARWGCRTQGCEKK